jgi:DNA-binding transcriptional ArsR family regulator
MPRVPGPKQVLFEHLAVIARAFGHAVRLELLDFLAQGERSVEDLAQVSGLSIAHTSKLLQQLKAAGLVQARRDGKHVRYVLGDQRVLDAVAALHGLAEAHIGAVQDLVKSYLMRCDALEPVPAAELLERMRDGLVTVLDVRPPEEYAQGHVAGALNVPLEATRKAGFEARRIENGLLEWRRAGLPVVAA